MFSENKEHNENYSTNVEQNIMQYDVISNERQAVPSMIANEMNQLFVTGFGLKGFHAFINNINSILSTLQITYLDIFRSNFSSSDLVSLMKYLPNLKSLIILSSLMNTGRHLSIDARKIFN